jgi:hypothetical protein
VPRRAGVRPAIARAGRSGAHPGLAPAFRTGAPVGRTNGSAEWARQPAGLHAAFGSTDRIYFRTEVPELDGNGASRRAAGWRGERLNAVIVIWSADAHDQVRLEPSDLTDGSGHVLGGESIRLQLVRYVLSNYPADARNATCDAGPTQPAWSLPDRLEPLDRFDVPARTVRPVWLSLDIPASAAPGSYTGSVTVRSGEAAITLGLTIQVQAPMLPPPSAWQFRLDLWQNPWVIAWRLGLQPWSEEHKSLLRQHLRLYAEAGGKYITTYAVHSPWQDSSYMIEGGMIQWIKRDDGSWTFDYRIFDEYVALAMEAGITQAITIYTPVPWGFRFHYVDERTGASVTESWPPDSSTFRAIWHAFLDDLKQHLEHKGWFGKTYLGINENPLDQTLAAIKMIKDHSPQWRITYAGDWHPELNALLDDYSFLFGKEPEPGEVRGRSSKGSSSTYYVCCTPAKPNTFVFSPPVEGRWLAWYAAARGYDGFLRWAYDAWPADPARDARHALWPAGDTFLVYPGGNSSIRFEKLREGIIDFEKMRILRSEASTSTDEHVKRIIGELDLLLTSLRSERQFDEEGLRRELDRGKQLIAELSDRLMH